MSTTDTEETGILNPVDEPDKRPFGAPAFMYSFYSFVLAAVLTFLVNYVEVIPNLVQVVLLFLAAGCFFESLALIFFEPSVMIGDDIVHHRARKPSVWSRPPRMFRWSGETIDEEVPYSDIERIELNYTRVPFPLPVFPFTCPFFYITRWILAMERDDGNYLLLEVGPTPDSLQAVAKKVSEYTERPLRAPWFNKSRANFAENWLWSSDTEEELAGDRVIESLQKTDLTFEKRGNTLEFPIENRMSAIWRSGGFLVAGCCLLVSMLAVIAGFQYDPGTPHGLLLSIIWMLSGAAVGVIGIWLFVDYGSPIRSRLRFDQEGVQVIHPVGQSAFIGYQELLAVRGVKNNYGASDVYGFGKPVPCLEVYGEKEWFFISLHDSQKLDRFHRVFQNLT